MNKNLEELKKVRKISHIENMPIIMAYLIPILEGFEKRLIKLERKEEGFGPRISLIKEAPMKKGGLNEMPATPRPKRRPKGQQAIKPERMDHLEIGAQIGKSREGPEPIKSGHGLRPKNKKAET